MADSNGRGKPHIALMAFPFASHPVVLFTFARMLASAAPGALFSFLTSSQSLASFSKTWRPENVRLYAVDDGCSEVMVNVVERIGLFIEAMPGNFVAGIGAAEKETGGVKVSCVVSDGFLPAAGEVAEGMGVPWVPLWTCGPPSLVAHLRTDELRRRVGVQEQADPTKGEELLHCIPALSAFRICDLPMGILSGDIHSGFSTLLHRAGNKLPHAAAIALNTFQGLNAGMDAEISSVFKKYLPVGPFNLLSPPPAQEAESESDRSLFSWLDRQGPATAAYVSYGNVMTPPRAELEELASGLEESGTPFLWSLKERSMEDLPEGFLDRTRGRGLVLPWVPQARVLGHGAVGAFVTHCGWNSLMEGIASGVPMICRPFLGDQPSNARLISHVWKSGVAFERGNVTREEMAKLLNVVLKEGEGKKMRERARELKDRATRAVENGGKAAENLESLLKIVCRSL